MSETAYRLVVHPAAKAELERLPDGKEQQMKDRLHTIKTHRNPLDHSKCKALSGYEDLNRLQIDGYRALWALSKPNLIVLCVDTRARIYDRIQTAQNRL